MNDACKAFGFPFRRVKCCREMECQCMEYKEKKFALKSSSAGEEMKPCMDCHHRKDRHYVLEKYGVVLLLHFVLTFLMFSIRLTEEPNSREHRRFTGGIVKDKQLLIDKSTGLGALQVHCLAL